MTHDRQPEHAGFARVAEMRERIEGPAGSVVVSLPRERAAARDRIARAAALGCPVLVDGQKVDGIDSLLKELRGRATIGTVISKAHGKIFALGPADLSDWLAEPARNDAGWLTPPGGFSPGAVDPGTALLTAALPPLDGHVVDLGAGWGALSAAVLTSAKVKHLDLVEAHRPSLDCARVNVPDPRAAFHWADATSWTPERGADHVVANPPFHKGRKGDPDLGRAFLATAARVLSPRGRLWLVANRHLPYEAALATLFTEVEELPGSSAFKLFRAARPRRRR